MEGQIVPANCAAMPPSLVAGAAQVRRRQVLPVPVPPGSLRLFQLCAGLVAVCLGVGVYLLLAEPQSNGIAAGAAVFVAVMEAFLTWLLPALFVEAS